MRSELALEPQAGGGKMQRSCLRPFRLPMLPRRAGLAAVLLACLAAAPASAQPPGSNAGLPPSATPTGLAGQKIIALNTHTLMDEFKYSDIDLMSYLLNVECLEASFDTYAAFGQNMHPALFAGGPTPIGGRKANLSDPMQAWVEEVARAEVGHVRLLREALGAAALPCPQVDIDKAFEQFFNAAFGTTGTNWDPYRNDINFVLSMFTLEEVGATLSAGAVGLAALNGNLTVVAIAAGLAGSAMYQSAADRYILWERRNEMVPEFNVTVTEFMDAMSALRQRLTGPVLIDQPLFFAGGPNIVPTDGNGVTLARTPQQVLHFHTLGSANGTGAFFPSGVNGRINRPEPLQAQVPPDLLAMANQPYAIRLRK